MGFLLHVRIITRMSETGSQRTSLNLLRMKIDDKGDKNDQDREIL